MGRAIPSKAESVEDPTGMAPLARLTTSVAEPLSPGSRTRSTPFLEDGMAELNERTE
jgi:hypothetical protein